MPIKVYVIFTSLTETRYSTLQINFTLFPSSYHYNIRKLEIKKFD